MMRKFAIPFLTAACVSTALVAPASADATGLVSVDVVDGWTEPDGTRVAGIRIRVAEGWKTYWRSPGDAGVPPRFNWEGSKNLAHAQIHWPRPKLFDTYGQRTLGYGGEVVLPVVLTPLDAALPITITGHAELGVCLDVCVAVEETYGESATDGAGAIQAGFDAQPARAAPEAARCHIEPIADGLRLTATLAVPSQGGDEWTVFEVLGGDVWVSEPELNRHGDALTATADLVPPEAAPFDLDPSQLRITVLGTDGALETVGCPAK